MELEKLRRVVTGHDAQGKSIVVIDGPPGSFVGGGAAGLGQIWVTEGSPADNSTKRDFAERQMKLEPPANGSSVLFFMLAPEDKNVSRKELEEQQAATFKALDAEQCRPDTSKHPGMHKTRTVDYVILLEGDVTLILEKQEVRLKPFDVVVQRGTNHAWHNNGSKPALLMGVLIDAKPL